MAESWQQWMPHQIDAWQGSANVQALSDLAYRAVHNLILDMWKQDDCALPDDDRELAKRSRIAPRWSECREEVMEYFTDRTEAGKITHRVTLREWQRAREKYSRGRKSSGELSGERSVAGKRGAEARWPSAGGERGRDLRAARLSEARQKGTHTEAEWIALVQFCNATCVRCKTPSPIVKDHIRPIYQGGSDAIENLQPLCRRCNCSKGAEFTDWRPSGWQKCLASASDASQAPHLTVTGTCTGTSTEAKTLRAVPRAQCELVYAEYPRKVGKEDALKAIAKAVGRLTRGDDLPALSMPEALEYLRRRVQAFARAPAGQRGEMTPHPATWFNKGRYLDDDKEWQETRNGSTGKDREHGHRDAPAIERRNITLDASRAAFARRYGPDDSAAVAANGGGIPQPDAAGGDAGHVPRQVGGDGPPLRGGDVPGRVIEGHR